MKKDRKTLCIVVTTALLLATHTRPNDVVKVSLSVPDIILLGLALKLEGMAHDTTVIRVKNRAKYLRA